MPDDRKPDPKTAARDRRPDAEAMGAVIFARLVAATGGKFASDALARTALAAAREYYRVCDDPTPPG